MPARAAARVKGASCAKAGGAQESGRTRQASRAPAPGAYWNP